MNKKSPINPTVKLLNEQQALQAGFMLMQQGQLAEAERNFQKVISSNPRQVDALNLLGIINAQSRNFQDAISFMGRAISINPKNASSYYNRGLALHELGRLEEALLDYRKATKINLKYANAFNGQGNAYLDMKDVKLAIESYEKALQIDRNYADAWNNLANAYSYNKQLEEALSCYDKALQINPHFLEAWSNRAGRWLELKNIEEALANYEKAAQINVDSPNFLGDYLHAKLQGSDWSDLTVRCAQILRSVSLSKPVSKPFATLSVLDDPALHREVAKIYIQTRFPQSNVLGAIPPRAASQKIRIGYYSADFRNHAIAYLIAEMLERHNKNAFEIYAFNLHPGKPDEISSRIFAAVNQVIDLSDKSDRNAAQLARALNIDIAIDLGGHTFDSRTGIFAHRCAPVQVNYLGFPGTLGAPYYDYILADATVIPEDQRQHYLEKVVYLPHCYQPNDSQRKISERIFSRSELGLPEHGFVFCCFNNGYKILPETFDGWMRVLHAVEGSVLWLLDHNPVATRNLQREAKARGIDARRLIFAARMPLAEHLARHRLADLFIDTLPYNAHTTASDALWAGLPVLTCMGTTFAARVAGSLLRAMDLPELITHTQAAFEARAIELAQDPSALNEIQSKLLAHRDTSPLFDAPLFTRHIEAAYRTMQTRYQAELPPEHFSVES